MGQKNVIIEPITVQLLGIFTECLMKNFSDKFGAVFKGIPSDTAYSIMKELISLNKKPSDIIDGFYIASIPQNQKLDVVGVLSLMNKKAQLKEKSYKDSQWKILRNYLNFWRSLNVGIKLDFLSAKKLKNDELYIDSISIVEKFRGRGFGTEILKFIDNLARSQNFKQVSLYVSCKNTGALNLYQKQGFQIINKRKTWIGKRMLKIPFFYLMVKNIS